jgi:hypothetical protein
LHWTGTTPAYWQAADDESWATALEILEEMDSENG